VDPFIIITTILALIFLVNSCIEVGSNDAANLVNAVCGAEVLKRKKAVILAGIFVTLGASFSSPVMDTIRKSIFDIQALNLYMTLSVFISAYFVSITLLYIYSLFGMPVSTTATLVFCLAGGACGALQSTSAVNWPQFFQVVLAIVFSVLISGFFAFFAQRIFRFFLGNDTNNHKKVIKHGSWIASLMLIVLLWFLLVKGMKHVSFIQTINKEITGNSLTPSLFLLWLALSLFLKAGSKILGPAFSNKLFHIISIFGMISMAFAFGQNDLANCASPGIAIFMIWKQGLSNSMQMNVPIWSLTLCGFLMFLGMLTQRAKRVSMAEIKTGSSKNDVVLYAPKWCIALASKSIKFFSSLKKQTSPIKPLKKQKAEAEAEADKTTHYDPLRASVILSVSASVIAFASSQGLPVSTTYVAFAAVIASGWGDHIFSNEQAELKLGRTLWVISGWFLGALGAIVSSFFIALLIYKTQIIGLLVSIVIFILFKTKGKSSGEAHAVKYDTHI